MYPCAASWLECFKSELKGRQQNIPKGIVLGQGKVVRASLVMMLHVFLSGSAVCSDLALPRTAHLLVEQMPWPHLMCSATMLLYKCMWMISVNLFQ